MMTVYKYPIEIISVQVVDLPYGAIALTAQMQGDHLCLWCKVDSDNADAWSKNKRKVYVHGTGHPIINPAAQYVSTAQDRMGLVWHVFIENV